VSILKIMKSKKGIKFGETGPTSVGDPPQKGHKILGFRADMLK
jgi:hypothetical protein